MYKTIHRLGTVLLVMTLILSMPLSTFAASATAISFERTDEMKAELGKTYRRTAITTPEGADVTYSSSNVAVATIDQTGLVRTVAEGKAVITAKSGNATASYNVVVSKAGNNATNSNESVPAEGYPTIWECAEAHPGNLYYQKKLASFVSGKSFPMQNPAGEGLGWFPISEANAKKYEAVGFDSREQLISVLGEWHRNMPTTTTFAIRQNKQGKWGLGFDNNNVFVSLGTQIYYARGQDAGKAMPTIPEFKYVSRERGWELATDEDIGDGFTYHNRFKNKGPYDTETEAEAVATTIMGSSMELIGFDNVTYLGTSTVVATKVRQNKQTGKWFIGVKTNIVK